MKSIYIGNLDFKSGEDEIRSLFEPFGTIRRVNVILDRATGRSRGFAFVEMANDADAEKAVAALNGTQLAGRGLHISEARPRENRTLGMRGNGGRELGGPSRHLPEW